ncbi:hypothetical protein [Catenulispora yoronensis]
MHVSIHRTAGALLVLAGGVILVGSTTFAAASSGTPSQPQVPSVKAVAGGGPAAAKPYVATAAQQAAIATATADPGIKQLLASQKSQVSGSKATDWSTVGSVVELTFSSPVSLPAHHPAVSFADADVASAKGYRTVDSPLRADAVAGLLVYVDARTGTVAGYQPLAVPGAKTVVVAPPGYTGP